MKSELDAIHRARLTQMNTLSTQSNLLLVYQKNLQDGQMEVKNLHAERYEAENQMSRVVEETEKTKLACITVKTAIRHHTVDLNRSKQELKSCRAALNHSKQQLQQVSNKINEMELLNQAELREIDEEACALKKSTKKLRHHTVKMNHSNQQLMSDRAALLNIREQKQQVDHEIREMELLNQARLREIDEEASELKKSMKKLQLSRNKLAAIRNNAPLPLVKRKLMTKTDTRSDTRSNTRSKKRRRRPTHTPSEKRSETRTIGMFGRL